jgi:hypothetical protein
MDPLTLRIDANTTVEISLRGNAGEGIERHELSAVPEWLGEEPGGNQDWFTWGRYAFDAVFGSGGHLRRLWDTRAREALAYGTPMLVRVENSALGDVVPFKWYWEAMIGTTLPSQDNPAAFYPFGRFPSPVDLVRTPHPAFRGQLCHQLLPHAQDGEPWHVALVRVPSIPTVDLACRALENYLTYLAGQSRNFTLVGTWVFNGHNGEEIADAFQRHNVQIADIVAHTQEDHPYLLTVQGQYCSWEDLLRPLSPVRSLQIVALSGCKSDYFVTGRVVPAMLLHAQGVPAVIAWHPRAFDTTLPHFHRAFYGAMARGYQVARAVSMGRAAVFQALDLRVPGHWIRACAPRLYVHSTAQIAQLRFPPPLLRTQLL